MKYGCVVHSFTDFSKSGSCVCFGSRVSVTDCCAGSEMTAAMSAVPRTKPQRRLRTARTEFFTGNSLGRDYIGVREIGSSVVREFGGSGVRWFGGSAGLVARQVNYNPAMLGRLLLTALLLPTIQSPKTELQWFRGNTHAHTLE